MANTEFLGMKLPTTADNIAEQINVDAPANLGKIDKAIKDVHVTEKQNIAENYLSAHNIPSTAKRGKLDVKLRGQSVVNLFGTDGDFEDLSKWAINGYTLLTSNTDKKVFGSKSLKVAKNNQNGYIHKDNVPVVNGKYYLISLYGYAESAISGNQNIYISDNYTFNNIQVIKYSFYSDLELNQWKRIGYKFQSTKTVAKFSMCGGGSDGSGTYYVDGVMLQEITADEYNNLTVDELMAKYPYHDGLQGAKPTVKSCGKNLFGGELEKNSINTDGTNMAGNNNARSKDYINIKPNTQYKLTYSIPLSQTDIYYYDKNKVFISTLMLGYTNNPNAFTTPNNAYFARIRYYVDGGVDISGNTMFEEGNVANPYEPYRGTEVQYKTLDGQPITLHKLPNGVCDEIVDGKFIKRIGEKTLAASDIGLAELTNVSCARFTKPLDYIGYGSYSYPVTNAYLGTYLTLSGDADDSANIGEFSGNYDPNRIYVIFAKGTTLETMQTALAGTKLIYQLAQPQILDTNATPLIAEPNGHVFITSEDTQPSVELSYPLNLGAVVEGLIEGQKRLSELVQSLITT